MSFVNGQGRKIFVNTTITVSQGSLPTSVVFTAVKADEFAGVFGMIKADSSFAALVQFQYQMDGGVTVVTSTIPITSGTVINELNPGINIGISVTGINANTPLRVYLTGLPIR